MISIIIVSYNSERFLNNCLVSVYKSDFKDFEVIVVDNASVKKVADHIEKRFLRRANFKLLRLEKNLGSAGGRNHGARLAKGEYWLFLDPDTVMVKDCLRRGVDFIQSHPGVGAVHAKLLNLERRHFFDYAGDYLDCFGFLVDRAKGMKDDGSLDYIWPILSGKTAAVLVKKEAYEVVEGFDEDYFFMLEDTDFDWKLWLKGYQVLFLPEMVVYHGFNTKEKERNKEQHYSNSVIKYYGARNYLLTLLKNLGTRKLITIVPWHVVCWLVMAVIFLFKGKVRSACYIVKGLGWNLVNLGLVLKKRRKWQKERVLTDRELDFLFISREKLNHYLGKIVSYSND